MRTIFILCFFCVVLPSFSQTIFITTGKTTSLAFPFAIKQVDRGSKEVLAKEAGAILFVKAATPAMASTNLSVVLSDGSLYAFEIRYADSISQYVYSIPPQQHASVASYANNIMDNPRTIWGIHDESWDMLVTLSGIYIRDDVIYYQFVLDNGSPIDYDIDFFRCYIRDKRKGRRTATQENEFEPLYVAGRLEQVKAFNRSTVVLALPKCTLPDDKYLAIEINERNGGRHLKMRVGNKKLVQARPLPDL